MNTNLSVRIAGTDEVQEIMDLTLSCHKENGFVDVDPQKVLRELWPALAQDNGVVGVIGEKGQPVQGCVVLRVGEMPYSTARVLEEKFLFVHKDYRAAKGGRARLLAEFTKRVADSLDIPLIIGVLSNHRTRSKVRLYERVFGEPAGAFFLYNARTDARLSEPEVEV